MKQLQNRWCKELAPIGVFVSLLLWGSPAWSQDEGNQATQPTQEPTKDALAVPTPMTPEVDDPPSELPTAPPDEPAPPRLVGEIPTKVKKVTLNANERGVAEILQDVSEQGGFGLVMDPSEASLQKKLTIQLKKKPFTEVLEIILDAANLKGSFKDDILFVTAQVRSEEDPKSDVLLEAGTDSDGAFLHLKTNSSKRKHKRHFRKHHKKNRVQIGKSVHIKVDEMVDDAVSVGGSLKVEGKVRGDAVAVGGDLTVEPTAHIHGDAVSVGGTLDVKPGATVEGEQVGVGIPFPIGTIFADDGEFNMTLPVVLSGIAGTFAAFSILRLLLQSLLLFVLAAGLTALAPKRVEGIRKYLSQRTGTSILAGLVIFIAFIPFIILLAITIIGIPLIPIAIIAMIVFFIFGQAAFLTWLGYKIPLFKSRKSQLGALTIGAVVTSIIGIVPIAGPLFLIGVGLVCTGAALLSRLGSTHLE